MERLCLDSSIGCTRPTLVSFAQMAVGGLPGVPGMQQPMSPASYNSGAMSVGSPVQVRERSCNVGHPDMHAR